MSGPRKKFPLTVTLAAAAALGLGVWTVRTQDLTGPASHQTDDARFLKRDSHTKRDREATISQADRAARLAEIQRLLAAARPVGRGELRNEAVIELLRELAKHDPRAATEFAAAHPELHGQVDLAQELFGGWLDRSEWAARDWLAEIPAGNFRFQLVPILVGHLASELPEEALELAGELPGYDGELSPLRPFGNWNHGDEIEGRIRERAYAEVFREWAGTDPVAAAARAQALDDSLLQNLAMQEVASKWILKDSAGAIRWMNDLPAGPVKNSALQGVLMEWTAQDPRSAAAFLSSMNEGPERNQWLRQVGEIWTATDPKAALAWASQLPSEADRHQTTQTVLAKVMDSGLQNAADFALTLPPGPSRSQGLEMVLPNWLATDAEGARRWIAGIPKDSVRAEATAIIATE